MEEASLTEEQKTGIHNFNYPDEEAVRKYLLCMTKKMGIFCHHDGKFITDRVVQQFKHHTDESTTKKITEECTTKHPKGDKEAEVHVYEINKCIHDSEIGENIKEYVKKHEDETTD